MKRILKLLLALSLALSFVVNSIPVLAVESPMQKETVEFSDSLISPSSAVRNTSTMQPLSLGIQSTEQTDAALNKAALELREGLKKHQDTVTVEFTDWLKYPKTQDSTAIAHMILENALVHTGNPTEGDYLRMNLHGCRYSIERYTNSKELDYYYIASITYTLDNLITHEQSLATDAAVVKLISSLKLKEKDHVAQLHSIYEWMCQNTHYDETGEHYSTYDILVGHSSVCQGYSSLFYRMAWECGIDTRVITGYCEDSNGEKGYHSWVIVKLDGKYYNIDPTWGASYYRSRASAANQWFLKSDKDFERHYPDAEYTTSAFRATYPMSSTSYPLSSSFTIGDPGTSCDHEWDDKVTTPATCHEKGVMTHTCIWCEKSDTETIDFDKTNHTGGTEVINARSATCKSTGYTGDTVCRGCSATLKKGTTIAKSTKHNYSTVVYQAPPCTSDGKTVSTCEDCRATVTKVTPATKKHTYVAKVVKNPTLTATGIRRYICSACNSYYDKAIPKLLANTITASNKTLTFSTKKQTFSIGAKVKGNAKLTYKSDNKSVTVDKNGKVTVPAKFNGQATITVTSAATSTYAATTKKIAVVVNPAAVAFTKVSPAKKQVLNLTWKKNANATGYQIQYSTDKSFKKKVTTKTISKNGTVKAKYSKLPVGTNYVRIRTYKTVGKVPYYSGWVVTSVKIKK